ncbi:ABC transporter permease [Myxococcota bacterium]|nr:ABC transporter permease [Myxococcota bacterium]
MTPWTLEAGRAWAFLRRDFLFRWSYKFGFLYDIGALFSSLVALHFTNRMLAAAPPPSVTAYGTDYFTFALVGIAFLDYMWVSMRSFAQQVRMAQLMGTLEAMLATPVPPFRILCYSALWPYAWTTIRAVLYLVLGVLVFEADFGAVNVLSAVVFLAAMVAAFAGLGIASAALTLYLKQADPITAAIGGVSFLFGGIVYPVASLPEALQPVAWALPMTHAVEGLRRAFLSGATLADLSGHLGMLVLWALLSFLLAAWSLRRVVRILSREGSFGAY